MHYTTVLHAVRRQFGLSCNEYCIADMIYHLSGNPEAPVPGWCSLSRGKMGEEMDLSRQSIISIIQRLVALGLVEESEAKNLRATRRWYDAVIASRESIKQGVKKVDTLSRNFTPKTEPGVKKVDSECKETLQDGCQESLHYNKSIDNNINNTPTPPKKTAEVVGEISIPKSLPKEAIILPLKTATEIIEGHRADILGAPISKDRECKKLKIQPEHYDLLTNAFFDKQLSDAERKVPIEFYRMKKHFDNWMTKQVNLGEVSTFHPNHKPATNQQNNGFRGPVNGQGASTITARMKSAIPD